MNFYFNIFILVGWATASIVLRTDDSPALVINWPFYYCSASSSRSSPAYYLKPPSLFSAVAESCFHLYHCSVAFSGRRSSPSSLSFLSWLRSRVAGTLHHYSSFARQRPDGRGSRPLAVCLRKLMSFEYSRKLLRHLFIKTVRKFLKCSIARPGLCARILSPVSLVYLLVRFWPELRRRRAPRTSPNLHSASIRSIDAAQFLH